MTNKKEHRGLLNLAPPPLYAPGVREEHLLNYTVFPPMNAPALQGLLHKHELSQFVFSPTFLALKLASLPSTSHTQQWHRFEFVCRAVAVYQEHVIVVPSGCVHTFTADIWLVGGGEMNVIIWQVGAWCKQSPTVVQYSPKVQVKEQLALKKNKWSLIIDMTWVIGEFGRPASV